MENKQAKILDGIIIFSDCISLVKPQENGKYKLFVFDNCKVIFEKEYKTFSAAKAQETRILKKI